MLDYVLIDGELVYDMKYDMVDFGDDEIVSVEVFKKAIQEYREYRGPEKLDWEIRDDKFVFIIKNFSVLDNHTNRPVIARTEKEAKEILTKDLGIGGCIKEDEMVSDGVESHRLFKDLEIWEISVIDRSMKEVSTDILSVKWRNKVFKKDGDQ